MRSPLNVKLYRSNLPIVEDGAGSSVQEAAEAGGGAALLPQLCRA